MPNSSEIWRRRVAIAAMLGMNLAAIVAMLVQRTEREWAGALMSGVLIAQILLLAIWGGLGNARALIRFSVSLLALVAVVAVLGFSVWRQLRNIGNSIWEYEMEWVLVWQVVVMTAIAFSLQWLAVFLPLFGLRCLRKLRIQRIDRTTPASGVESQFNLRQLLIATGIAAVLFGLGRVLVKLEIFEGVEFEGVNAWSLAILTVGNLLLGVLAPQFALAPRWFIGWLLVGFLYAAAIGGIVYAVTKTAFPSRPGADLHWLFYGALHGWLMACLLLMRVAGYRLIRRRHSASA